MTLKEELSQCDREHKVFIFAWSFLPHDGLTTPLPLYTQLPLSSELPHIWASPCNLFASLYWTTQIHLRASSSAFLSGAWGGVLISLISHREIRCSAQMIFHSLAHINTYIYIPASRANRTQFLFFLLFVLLFPSSSSSSGWHRLSRASFYSLTFLLSYFYFSCSCPSGNVSEEARNVRIGEIRAMCHGGRVCKLFGLFWFCIALTEVCYFAV